MLSETRRIEIALASAMLHGCSAELENLINENPEEVSRQIKRHGIASLIYERIKSEASLPAEFIAGLKTEHVASLLWEQQHRQIITQIVKCFEQEAIQAVFFKGTALAYSHYPKPELRKRGDTDIYVANDDFEKVIQILDRFGFIVRTVPAKNYTLTAHYLMLKDERKLEHHIDLHRQINSYPLIAKYFPFDAVWAQSKSTTFEDETIQILSDVEGFLLAAFHHHSSVAGYDHKQFDSPHSQFDLLWLYDIHLLASSFDQQSWQSVTEKSQRMDLSKTIFTALCLTQSLFETEVPDWVFSELEADEKTSDVDRFLSSGYVAQLFEKLLFQDSFRSRIGYAFEMLYPNTDFLRIKYKASSISWPSILHIRWILDGLLRCAGLRARD